MKSFWEKVKTMKILAIFLLSSLFNLIICKDASAQIVVSPEGVRFDTEYYASNNPEIVEEYGDAFEGLYRHYLEHGKMEGRYPNAEEALKHNAGTPAALGNNNNPGAGIIIVGDSRVYLMHQSVGDDVTNWFARSGTGINTLKSEMVPQIDKLALDGKKIVIMYGINDLFNYGSDGLFNVYNDFFATKGQEWINRGAKVYYVDLIGVGKGADPNGIERPSENIRDVNALVERFNGLIGAFPKNIGHIHIKVGIDLFKDGIHFTPEEDKEIYRIIINEINK